MKLNVNECKVGFNGKELNCGFRYYMYSVELELVGSVKKLGAVFDSKLSFVSHWKEKIDRAYSMLSLRNFVT